MLKPLVAVAAAVAILSASGCCWPLHDHHRGRYGDRYDGRADGRYASARPLPRSQHDRDRDGR